MSLILRSSLPVNQPLTNDQMDGNFVYLQGLISQLTTTVAGIQSGSGGSGGSSTVTLVGDVVGSGTGNITTTLSTTGVIAGSYNNVTVNTKGLVIGASNVAYAGLFSPQLVGIPTAPTATVGTNTNQLATCAFVLANAGSGGGGGAATSLSALLDVLVTGPASGQVLTYNGTKWINQAPASPTLSISGLVPVGTILPFAGITVPTGFLLCPNIPTNVSRITYSALFAVIGTTWGSGDGSTTFGLPYFPLGYTTVNGTVGDSTIGQVISHTHTGDIGSATASTSTGGGPYPCGATGAGSIHATGGAANFAAGIEVQYIIAYNSAASIYGGGSGGSGGGSNLGYTPVQQGTGIGQTATDTVQIGWDETNSRLKATVNNTDLGAVVFDSNVNAIVQNFITTNNISTTPTVLKILRSYHNFILWMNNNRIITWGYDNWGQDGQGQESTTNANFASEVQFPSYLGNIAIQDVMAIGGSVYVLFANQELYVWGYNGYGNLGIGSTNNAYLPTLSTTHVAALIHPPTEGRDFNHNGLYTTVFIKKTDGLFYGCGFNTWYQLSTGDNNHRNTWTAMIPPVGKTIKTLWPSPCTNQNVFCQTTDNLVYAIGYNSNGQLGLGNNTASITTWTHVPYFDTITDIAAIHSGGYYYDGTTSVDVQFTLAHTISGHIHSTGYNAYGELGLNNTTARNTFTQVTLTKSVAKVLKSDYSTYVIFTDHTYACWGYNGYGQLGDGTTVAKLAPIYFSTIVTDIFMPTRTGFYSSYLPVVILTSTGVYGTGPNSYNVFGLGPAMRNVNLLVPTLITINRLDIKDWVGTGANTLTGLIMFNNDSQIMGAGYNAEYELNDPLSGNSKDGIRTIRYN